MKTNLKYDAVLYDFDGTLADSVPAIVESFKLAYIELFGECTRTEEDFRSYIGLPLARTFEMHDPETADKLVATYLNINEKMLRDGVVGFFPGIYEMLTEIQEMGVKQGIVTSKSRNSTTISLDVLDAWKYFDANVFREDTDEHKPAPAPLIEGAKRMGITDMSRVLYVGDALPDALCAKNAGCDFALVDWTAMDRNSPEMANPTYLIKETKDLSCIIKTREL